MRVPSITVPPLKPPAGSPKILLPKFNNGHWHFPEQLDAKANSGFIYVVRDNFMGKFYLGKKAFKGSGKLNKGVESQWRTYQSSSKFLKTMIENRPIEEFDFIVLEQYKTKGTLSYSETWSLCLVEAPTSNTWMNERIEPVSWSVKEPISDRHKDRLSKVIAGVKFDERY